MAKKRELERVKKLYEFLKESVEKKTGLKLRFLKTTDFVRINGIRIRIDEVFKDEIENKIFTLVRIPGVRFKSYYLIPPWDDRKVESKEDVIRKIRESL